MPLFEMVSQPSLSDLWQTTGDKDIVHAIRLSVYTAGIAAAFVGMSNRFPAVFENGSARINTLHLSLIRSADGDKHLVAIRPEDIRICHPDAPAGDRTLNRFQATLTKTSHKGLYCDMVATTDGLEFKLLTPASEILRHQLEPGCQVAIHLPSEHIHLL